MPTEVEARKVILDLLAKRGEGKTICPSEAARALGGDDGFRELMPMVRETAAWMADSGEVEVTQGGEVVDVTTARGPVRLRKPAS